MLRHVVDSVEEARAEMWPSYAEFDAVGAKSSPLVEDVGARQLPTRIIMDRVFITAGLLIFFIVGYFGVGRLRKPGHDFEIALPLDAQIPFIAQSVWIYCWAFTAALIPLFVVRCPRLFRHTAAAYGTAIFVALLCFKIFPATSAALRPDTASLDVSSFSEWAVSVIYSLDPPYNLFPSLHVAITGLAAFSAWKAKRIYGAGIFIGVGLVAVAVCTVKQHFVLDVIGGLGLATLVGGLIILPYQAKRNVERAYSWRAPAAYIGLLVLFHALTYAAYLGRS
jgi:membrane-associated phospholipid phosphatase